MMKLTILLITLSISLSSWSFVNDDSFVRPIKIFERQRPQFNTGIVLKTERSPAQVRQNNASIQSQRYPGGNAGEWKVLKKAESSGSLR